MVSLIPRDVLFGNPDKAAPAISPCGKFIAYIAPHNGVLNVFVRHVDQTDDRVVTNDTRRGIRAFFWQADGRHILYVQDRDGDENWHLYQSEIESGETRDLTPFPGVKAMVLAVDHKRPNEIVVALNKRTATLHDVYRLNLEDGSLVLAAENPGDFGGWSADNDLAVRGAFVVLPGGGIDIRVRDTDQAPWRSLFTSGPEESFGGIVGFSPDNKRILIISSIDANAARLVEIELASGKLRVIAEDQQFDIEGVEVHPTTKELQAVAIGRHDRTTWQYLDRPFGRECRRLNKTLRNSRGEFHLVSRDLSDQTWIVRLQ